MFKFMKKSDQKKEASRRGLLWTGVVFSLFGTAAALTLAIEKVHLLENPDAQLSCSINIVLNCASVINTWQASLFGFSNTYIGLMAYPIVFMFAVGGLLGMKFPRKILLIGSVGHLLGAIFAYWLFFQSVYVIQVLCPWCLVVTFSTTILLGAITRFSLRENAFNFSKKTHDTINKWLDKDYDKLLEASWLLLMFVLVYIKFGNGIFGV